MITHYKYNNIEVVCINTGMVPRAFAQSTAIDFLHEYGYRIGTDGSVESFTLTDTVVYTDAVSGSECVYIPLLFEQIQPVLHGTPEASCTPVTQPVNVMPDTGTAIQEVLRYLSRFVQAYKSGAVPQEFFAAALSAGSACFWKSDTDLIVLPPQLMLRCRAMNDAVSAADTFQVYPAVQAELTKDPYPAAAFLIAAMVYMTVSQRLPFSPCSTKKPKTGAEPEPAKDVIGKNIRDGLFIPLRLLCPAVEHSCAAAVDAGLGLVSGAEAERTVHQLCGFSDHPQLVVPYEACPEEAARLNAYTAQKFRSVEHKRFLRAHAGAIIAGAAAGLILIAAAVSIAVKLTAPPATHGVPARDIVIRFYESVENLEHAALPSLVRNHADQEYGQIMLHLFVTGKMREVYEQKKIYYTPAEFIEKLHKFYTKNKTENEPYSDLLREEGMLLLNGGAVYGISNLTITSLAESDSEAVFDVAFYYWLPLFPATQSDGVLEKEADAVSYAAFPLQITFHRDRVHLTCKKGTWYIDSVHVQERTLCEDSAESLLERFLTAPADLPEYLKDLPCIETSRQNP